MADWLAGAAFELRTTKECASVELLGTDASSKGGRRDAVEKTEAGGARTFSWAVGGVSSHYTVGLAMKRSDETLPPSEQGHLVQLSATYKHASGGTRMRVSTLRMPRLPTAVPARQLLAAFDQQAAAALIVRQAVSQAESSAAPAELLTAIDRQLIKVMKALCAYAKGEPGTVALPPQAAMLPSLVFNLRRSPAVRTSGYSPDETAYFRQLVVTLSVFASLVLVQPTLYGYERGGAPQPLPLEAPSMVPERSLLLDTYLKLLLCHGASVANWRRSPELQDDAMLQELLRAGRADLDRLESERFPAPEVFECEQYGSKARYLVQKLNPDVPLSTFLQGLYKAIVA